jgi:hypothetical protein
MLPKRKSGHKQLLGKILPKRRGRTVYGIHGFTWTGFLRLPCPKSYSEGGTVS